MVYENQTVLIIMVCNLIEKNFPKCHQYWSPYENIKNFSLEITAEKELDKNLVERTFQLTCTKTNEIRSIRHIHFVGWPDHGVPELNEVYDSFNHMLKAIDEAKQSSSGPVVVHCSAGVGRTGTLIALYNLHYTIQKQIALGKNSIKFNIWNTVRKLKEQRRFMVESVLQYRFLYSFLAKYLLNIFKK
jgi:protein tyrosine phosphatase